MFTEEPPPNCKYELNTNFTSWRLLQKKVTDFVRKDGLSELSQISLDEVTECSIYDS
jgi:hypothetical protein